MLWLSDDELQSGTHWDEKGVEPDYAFSSDEAFDKAYQLALARLAAD